MITPRLLWNSHAIDEGIIKPTSKLSFKVTKNLVMAFLKIFIRLEIKGRENLPTDGPIIAVCNHLHMADPALHIISILPRDSIFMAKEELFRYRPSPIVGIIMRVAEALPVPRYRTTEDIEKTLQKAQNALEEGFVLGIYPEGTRSQTGQLKTAYSGTTIIALRSKAPLIPIGIWGTEKLKGKGWLCRPRVTINFGQPFTLYPVDKELTNSQVKPLTDYLMSQLATVLPPEYRGKYKEAVELSTRAKVHAEDKN